jgi:hypothetical protein
MVNAADLVADDLRRRVPDAQFLAKLRVERLKERLIEIGDGSNSGTLVIDHRKAHAAAEKLPVNPVERGDRALKMPREAKLVKVVRVSDVVEELFQEWDAQMRLRLLEVEPGGVVGAVPENPGGKEAVEGCLDQARPEEPVAFFVLDVEGEPKRLPVVVEQGRNGFEVGGQPLLRVPSLTGKDLDRRDRRSARSR